MLKVGIINCGVSNIFSVYNAFSVLDAQVIVIDNLLDFEKCSHLVLPGVGSFPAGMRNLKKSSFDEKIVQEVSKGKPLLGICLGMQLLVECGVEGETTPGLGLIPGHIVRLKSDDISIKLPHMGWNQIQATKNSPFLENLKPEDDFFFAHSYVYEHSHNQFVSAECIYGKKIAAIIEKDNIIGVQFHPEKSQMSGLTLLKRFIC